MERREILTKIEELELKLQEVRGSECEVYSRIVGYFRPVKQWNNGKQAEFEDRAEFIPAPSEEKVC